MYDAILQKYLRQFEPLKQAEVGYRTELQGNLAPYLVLVHGLVSIDGNICQYEAEIDMRDMNGPGDLERLAGMLIESFEKASASPQKLLTAH
jgi:hypothetical protein